MSEPQQHVKRRKHQRYEISGPVKVWHVQNKQHIGVVANLSIDGLMLASSEPLESDRLYALELHLPEETMGMTKVPITVDWLWASESGLASDVFWSGCHIIDCSDEGIAAIESLISCQNK